MFIGLEFIFKNRKSFHLRFSWPARWNTSQVTGNLQFIFKPSGLKGAVYFEYLQNVVFPSTYMAWKKIEGNHQETNSPAHCPDSFGLLLLSATSPTHHRNHQDQNQQDFPKGSAQVIHGTEETSVLSAEVGGSKAQIPPLLLLCWLNQAPCCLWLMALQVSFSACLQKDMQKYLMPSGWKWNRLIRRHFPCKQPDQQSTNICRKSSPISLNPKLGHGSFFWNLACS